MDEDVSSEERQGLGKIFGAQGYQVEDAKKEYDKTWRGTPKPTQTEEEKEEEHLEQEFEKTQNLLSDFDDQLKTLRSRLSEADPATKLNYATILAAADIAVKTNSMEELTEFCEEFIEGKEQTD